LSTLAAIVLLLAGLGPLSADPDRSPKVTSVSQRDIALISEIFHLQNQLASKIWPQWSASNAPFLLKTDGYDFLINHPHPPDDFTETRDSLLGAEIWSRPNEGPGSSQATYPINGAFTVEFSQIEEDYDPCLWVLKAAHELFHVYQHDTRSDRIVEPFVGGHADENELSYPFPYDDEAVQSLMRLEAEFVFRFIMADSSSALDVKMTQKSVGHVRTVASRVFADSSDWKYKQWMEWNEGVARYTERELAAIARDPMLYRPSASFIEHFPQADYAETWESHYSKSLNPIRFVGEGVKGRVMFYYLGMGKAYALDGMRPGWRERYFELDLDGLIEGSEQARIPRLVRKTPTPRPLTPYLTTS
jgi:hypothetical protein